MLLTNAILYDTLATQLTHPTRIGVKSKYALYCYKAMNKYVFILKIYIKYNILKNAAINVNTVYCLRLE